MPTLQPLYTLEIRPLRGLRQLLVRGRGHVPPNLNQHRLHREVALPRADRGQSSKVDLHKKLQQRPRTSALAAMGLDGYLDGRGYLAVLRVHAGEVHFADEGHFRRDVRVVGPAVDFE